MELTSVGRSQSVVGHDRDATLELEKILKELWPPATRSQSFIHNSIFASRLVHTISRHFIFAGTPVTHHQSIAVNTTKYD
jgi:hypothetical protein